ncbi:E3 ubiquitin-protein ligase MARCH3-like [Anoplophora glabripennis]|uniref:E3 ubiquitin-protein ligase MARCH3-like n=1 Tax=Anoplophora glabripennis TaxID=217634 RepID=UPI0008752027|nr:E3 ubiquitin-protein ligase MARCH3-like [Anoplophora glabripennis]
MSEEFQTPKQMSINSPGPKVSIISVACRICYDNEREEELINPCRCKGTVAFVHRSCLETWLGESNTTTCELCHQEFKTERTPRFSSRESICRWCFTNSSGGQGVRSDVIACTLITPLAIVITYVCLFSSEYYNQKKFSSLPAARWTSISLLIMIGIMLIGYYMWVYSVIRMHARLWYNWWQRTCEVRYIPPSTINITGGTPSTVLTGHPNTPVPNLNEGENETAITVSGEEINQQEVKRSDHVVVIVEDDARAGTSFESIV